MTNHEQTHEPDTPESETPKQDDVAVQGIIVVPCEGSVIDLENGFVLIVSNPS